MTLGIWGTNRNGLNSDSASASQICLYTVNLLSGPHLLRGLPLFLFLKKKKRKEKKRKEKKRKEKKRKRE